MNTLRNRPRVALAGLAAALLVVAALFAPLPLTAAPPAARAVDVAAYGFGFTPARIRVNRGDTVTLTLRSTDVAHGLYLDGYGVSITSIPGVSQHITFTADQPGTYRFRCSVSCGTMHPFMIGQLEVAPNSPWLRGAALTVAVTLGALLALWAREV